MKRNDFILISCFVLVAVILFLLPATNIFTAVKKPVSALPAQAKTPEMIQNNEGQTKLPGNDIVCPTPIPTLAPAKCYLLVTIGDTVFMPYPLLNEQDLPITQADGMKNIVCISPDGFYMASATCDNQDCVHQGKVTLDNRDVRLLGNQVVCLPNKVVLELLTPEEAQIVWNNAYGDGEE